MIEARSAKTMTMGEGGLAIAMALLAFVCIFAAAKAQDAPFAFHAYLGAAAAVAAVFAIFNRYFARPVDIPQEIDGRPNYQLGPVKFACVASVFWGLAGAQLRPAMDQLRSAAPAPHLGGDFRLRRQRADRDLVLRGAEDLPHPHR